ncbi:MAG TPA: dihydropteroate synthase [Terriglobales bacterium]|jgi:dihydropteroate synthase|nr:dihydropteroate synthase [Terriglobales bacterium]
MRAIFQWNLGSRTIELGRRTLIMGVVNVTPDSFSDGGQYFDAEKAVARAEQLLSDGAALVDVGGESTRPGAGATVTEEEERKRVLPVVRDLKRRRPDAIVSVDTYKASVARAAVEAGAEIVNDISGFRWDAKMAKTIAELKVGGVLMHTRGRPDEWRGLPPIGDPVLIVKRDLRQWAEAATLAGIKRDHIALDPGFGFGKSLEENYPLLAHFADLQQMGYPLVAGTSRKSFIGRTLARDGQDAPVEQRLHGTLATETALILKGAHIIRTHDVGRTVEAARVADAIVASGG